MSLSFCLILSDCCWGGEEICKKTSSYTQCLLTYWVKTSLRINGQHFNWSVCLPDCFFFFGFSDFWFCTLSFFVPLQEDFLWWERQTGGGRVIERPDGDHCRTQQCHTDKYHREQSMMGRGNPQPDPKHFLQQHRARNTAGVLIFQCP